MVRCPECGYEFTVRKEDADSRPSVICSTCGVRYEFEVQSSKCPHHHFI